MIEVFEIITVPMAQFNFSGGVGNAVAAAMETKGLIDQARMLVDFRETLELIASLAWLFSICMAIGAVAVFGNYRQGLYLLLGPPLFYYMITTTIPTDGAKAIFGDREVAGSVDEQRNLLEWVRVIGNGNETVNVSFFFGVFDSVITEVVQSVVALILDQENLADLRFEAREKVLSHVLSTRSDSSELSELVIGYNVGECGDVAYNMLASKDINNNSPSPVLDTTSGEASVNKAFDHEWNTRTVVLPPKLVEYLISFRGQQGAIIPYLDRDDRFPVSCSMIWNFTRTVLFDYAQRVLTVENLSDLQGGPASRTVLEEALENVQDMLYEATQSGNEQGANNPRGAVEVVAAHIYRNILTTSSYSSLQNKIYTRAPVNVSQFENVFGSLGDVGAYSGLNKVRYLSLTIPYIQGIMIYLLTIAFPFFAVFLVLPGKATSFLVWCSLWAWIKSWDIGFAIVHVIRDVYWGFMRDKVDINNVDFEWSDDPSTVYQFIFSNDPLFNQNTYWIISSVLVASVPFITAHLAMGANSYIDMFSNSLDQTTNRFANLQGSARRRHQANITERMQYELNAMNQRQGAEFGAKNAALQNLNGDAIPLQDLRKGPLYGAMTYNKATGKWSATQGASDSRPFAASETAKQLAEIVQNGSLDYINGGMQSSIEGANDLAKSNIAANARAKELRGAIDEKTRNNQDASKEKEELKQLRKKNGYDNEDTSAKKQKIVNQLQTASGKKETKLRQQLEALKGASTGEINLPEKIAHLDRGGIQLNGSVNGHLDSLSMQRFSSDQRKVAKLYKGHGRTNDAKRALRKARQIDKLSKEGKSISWASYVRYEKSKSNELQDRLTVETRRKQYLLKRTAGRDLMKKRLDSRITTVLNAQNFFDRADKLRDIPVGPHKDFLYNPTGEGRVYKGDAFGGTGIPSFIKLDEGD